jgi:hypothetical protein
MASLAPPPPFQSFSSNAVLTHWRAIAEGSETKIRIWLTKRINFWINCNDGARRSPAELIAVRRFLPAQANAALAIARAQRLVLEQRSLLEGWLTLVLRNS